jgi:hypothetical protein
MTPLTELLGQKLLWHRGPESRRKYVLEGASGEAARLAFTSSWGGSLASGQTAHGEWTFKRGGFLHPRITVRRAGADADCAVLSVSNMGNGTLSIEGAGEYNLASSGWLHRSWEFTSAGSRLLHFEQSHGGAEVEILSAGVPPESLSLLLLLGWYFPVLADEDAAAISASTAAIIATM